MSPLPEYMFPQLLFFCKTQKSDVRRHLGRVGELDHPCPHTFVYFWSGVVSPGFGLLVSVSRDLNATTYRDITDDSKFLTLWQQFVFVSLLFQHNDASVHKAAP